MKTEKRSMSPLSEKLNMMNVFANNIQSTLDQEKTSKFEFLHQKMNEVEEFQNEGKDNTNKKFTVVKDNVKIS